MVTLISGVSLSCLEGVVTPKLFPVVYSPGKLGASVSPKTCVEVVYVAGRLVVDVVVDLVVVVVVVVVGFEVVVVEVVDVGDALVTLVGRRLCGLEEFLDFC